jgi:hypothetical protein
VCKIKNADGIIKICQIKEFLFYTFGFSPLDDEIDGKLILIIVEIINTSGKSNPQDEFKWEEMASLLNLIKENMKNKSMKSVKYTSYQHYHDDIFKHKRKESNPDVSYKNPVTYSQNYGFYKFSGRNINKCDFPKRKCEETKYAENLLLTGRFGR